MFDLANRHTPILYTAKNAEWCSSLVYDIVYFDASLLFSRYYMHNVHVHTLALDQLR